MVSTCRLRHQGRIYRYITNAFLYILLLLICVLQNDSSESPVSGILFGQSKMNKDSNDTKTVNSGRLCLSWIQKNYFWSVLFFSMFFQSQTRFFWFSPPSDAFSCPDTFWVFHYVQRTANRCTITINQTSYWTAGIKWLDSITRCTDCWLSLRVRLRSSHFT